MLHWLATLVLGVCNDLNTNCYSWMLDGQCQNNTKYMHQNCPLSCRVCEHNCTDTHEDCTYWAKTGECQGNNTHFMLTKCPTACGVCTPRCEDTHGGYTSGPSANESMCDLWARQGDCDSNPDYVLKHCPVACGVCQPKCKDLHADCHTWAGAGECRNNTDFMLKMCPNSCGVCANATKSDQLSKTLEVAERQSVVLDKSASGHCHDVDGLECSKWVANGECRSNPGFMLGHCAESCGLCTHVCEDHDAQCSQWAQMKEGKECDENKAFMQKTCPGSCGVCTELQKHLAGANAKEEL